MATAGPSPAPAPPSLARKVAKTVGWVLAYSAALGFVGFQLPTLWSEWTALRAQQSRLRSTEMIGYIDVNPVPNFAEKPDPWIRVRGEKTQIWAGWRPGSGHTWFEFANGDLDTTQLYGSFGRDVFRAVHKNIVESRGGEHWNRIPPEAEVLSITRGGQTTACPLLLLQLTWIVFDHPGDQRLVLLYNAQSEPGEAFDAFDPTLDGEVVLMGSTGHFLNNAPMLYDRATESLWSPGKAGIVALTGARKGATLKRIERPTLMTWEPL